MAASVRSQAYGLIGLYRYAPCRLCSSLRRCRTVLSCFLPQYILQVPPQHRPLLPHIMLSSSYPVSFPTASFCLCFISIIRHQNAKAFRLEKNPSAAVQRGLMSYALWSKGSLSYRLPSEHFVRIEESRAVPGSLLHTDRCLRTFGAAQLFKYAASASICSGSSGFLPDIGLSCSRRSTPASIWGQAMAPR